MGVALDSTAIYIPQEKVLKGLYNQQHSGVGYKDFIPSFKGEFFNADEWIDLFQKAGAKYKIDRPNLLRKSGY
jgi:hypothetical protein